MAKIIQFPERRGGEPDPNPVCVECKQIIGPGRLYTRTPDGDPMHIGACPSAPASVFTDARSTVGVWWPQPGAPWWSA